jgi:SAM-dependent methyltransferase
MDAISALDIECLLETMLNLHRLWTGWPMMNAQTLSAYEASAAVRCQHYRLILSTELLQFAHAFSHSGQLTADLGCGSGRDVDWLNRHGFPAIGYDASPAMLAEARAAYPDIELYKAALPDLAGIPDSAYANVLCSAVLMNLPRENLITAVFNLARVLQSGGACCSPTAPAGLTQSARRMGGCSRRSHLGSSRRSWNQLDFRLSKPDSKMIPIGLAYDGSPCSPRNVGQRSRMD